MKQVVPIQTIHLFPILDEMLISFLASLSTEHWQQSTIAKKWKVRDIATHLLDGNVRTLSMLRDGHFVAPANPIHSYQDLVDYLNELNADWTKASQRLSPKVILDLLQHTGKQYCAYLATLDPFEEAVFSVAWTGEEKSLNWFHIAREYTEKFIHQQQIRDAFEDKGLMRKDLFYPFIHTFMQGLPHTFRDVIAEQGTAIKVSISTEIGGDWYLQKNASKWELTADIPQTFAAEIAISPEIAWKLFSKGMKLDEAKSLVEIKGNQELGQRVLHMVSVMA
ncbi:maleylpyruvate isomerase N-terminal domain-containing protein [Peijinzhouia sedimentorum]